MKSIILTTREELEEILVEVLRHSKDELAPTPSPLAKPEEDPILSMAEAGPMRTTEMPMTLPFVISISHRGDILKEHNGKIAFLLR